MKPRVLSAALLSCVLFSSGALADDDCTDPVANWQPREVLRQQLEQKGWTVRRIKVDDGCYEVKGIDSDGNEFKATFAPASLRLLKLKTKHRHEGAGADRLGRDQKLD